MPDYPAALAIQLPVSYGPSSHNVWRDQAEKKGPAIKGDTASKEQQLHYGGMEAPSHAHPDPRLNNYQKVTK